MVCPWPRAYDDRTKYWLVYIHASDTLCCLQWLICPVYTHSKLTKGVVDKDRDPFLCRLGQIAGSISKEGPQVVSLPLGYFAGIHRLHCFYVRGNYVCCRGETENEEWSYACIQTESI